MTEAWTPELSSREEVLYLVAGGHTGGDIQFGPDGMLFFPEPALTPLQKS
tara:strand:+ start:1087 stop:1236 length:150 start_codon:yes stop_codon:yes gene_type:complete